MAPIQWWSGFLIFSSLFFSESQARKKSVRAFDVAIWPPDYSKLGYLAAGWHKAASNKITFLKVQARATSVSGTRHNTCVKMIIRVPEEAENIVLPRDHRLWHSVSGKVTALERHENGSSFLKNVVITYLTRFEKPYRDRSSY